MQKIIPHLWFDKEAKEAAAFYVSIFPKSNITSTNQIKDTPSGDCDIVSFKLWDYSFMAISAGPYFKLNPSISFMVNFDPLFFDSKKDEAKKKLDQMWKKLSDGGKILMPLDKYPFSERYGWVQDKYGVSWQLILTNPEGENRPPIMPSLLFVGDVCGKAEEAVDHYTSIFKNSSKGMIARYPAGQKPNKEGTVMFSDFMLEGQWFAAMDSALKHEFRFNEAISLLVSCDTQKEIDYYWKLSADPKAEQCGWIKDKYGVSWQVSPANIGKMISDKDPQKAKRVTQAFLKMKKFDIAALEKAYKG